MYFDSSTMTEAQPYSKKPSSV